MVCDKCNRQMKAVYGPQHKNNKGQIYRSVLLKCQSCNTWKQELQYITYKEIDGAITPVYRFAR